MKTMAEVLYDHREDALTCYDHDAGWCCVCGEHDIDATWRDHVAAALSAAGFGLVADAKGEALEEAADVIKSGDFTVPNNAWANTGLSDLATWDEVESILRARAAAVRGEG